MAEKKLRVRAHGTAMVVDFGALEAGGRRYIGRVFDATLGPAGGWPAVGDVLIPYRTEYIRALRQGDLEAADADTAAIAGVALSEVL